MATKTFRGFIFALIMTPAFVYAAGTNTDDLTEVALAVNLNQADRHAAVVMYEDAQKNLYISQENLEAWNIQIPADQKPIIKYGKPFYNFTALPGAAQRIDTSTDTAFLKLPNHLFKPQSITVQHDETPAPQRPPLGGFLSYDVFSQYEKDSPTPNETSGYFNLGAFGSFGSAASSFTAASGPDQNHFVRLNSDWTFDNPTKMTALTVGDSFTSAGMWGGSADMGGIQWGSDFATQPNFVTFPLPSVNGNAIAPSLADIYLNNSLIGKENLSNGPFSLQNLPIVTGTGDLKMVVTNLLGKQEVVDIPYYADPHMLKPGLHRFALSAGFIRQNFGSESNDYGQFLISGSNAYGITKTLTQEWHTELRKNTQTVGTGAYWQVGTIGVLSGAVALSHHDFDDGDLVQLGFDHLGTKFSYGFETNILSDNFSSLNFDLDNGPTPRAQTEAFLSFPFLANTSLGFSYISQINRDTTNQNIVTANYSFNPLHVVSMTLTGLTDLSNHDNKAIMLTANMSLGQQTSVSGSAENSNGQNQFTTRLQHSAPTDGGLGYFVGGASGSSSTQYEDAGVSETTSFGVASAQVAHSQGVNDYQLEASGGAVFMDNQLHLTRYSNSSFALVEVPGQANIPIYFENNPVAKTNANGFALIPNLIPYSKNRISIEPNDLSLNTTIDATHLFAVPYYRSGVLTVFPVTSNTSVIFTAKQASGNVVPMSASITVNGQPATAPVGQDGLVYLTNLQPSNKIIFAWGDHQCTMTLNYKTNNMIQDNLGTQLCSEK